MNINRPAKLISLKDFLWIIIIVAITLTAFSPVTNNEFTNWDDNEYITENPLIRDLSTENLKAIFTDYYFGIYHPVTLLTFSLNYKLGGLDPSGYYFTNILLHIINTILVFVFIKSLTSKRIPAILTSILFGIATIHVEPVAWISSRKDLLYTMFYLASIIFYLNYLYSINSTKGKYANKPFFLNRFYLLSIFIFLFSLLSKGTAVSLSITLIITDYLKSRDLLSRKVIFEKIPFFSMSLFFGYLAVLAPKSVGAFSYVKVFPFFQRIVFASYGYVQYIIKSLVPYKFSAFYPYPVKAGENIPIYYFIYPVMVIAIIFLIIISFRKYRKFVFGLLFFTVNIFLVLQLLPLGGYVMADRYAYLPSTGIFFIVGISLSSLFEKKGLETNSIKYLRFNKLRFIIIPLIISYILINVWTTNQQTRVWKNSLTLWNDVISKYPTVTVAWNNRGLYKKNHKDLYGALSDYNTALKYNPDYVMTYSNRGLVKKDLGNLRGALKDFDQAIKRNPNNAVLYYNKGITNNLLQKYAIATENLNRAIELDPDFADAYSDRGISKVNSGDPQDAIKDFSKAIELKPNFMNAYFNRGVMYNSTGNYSGSIADFNTVLKINPEYGKGYFLRGLARISNGEKTKGCNDLNKALDFGIRQAKPELDKHCRK